MERKEIMDSITGTVQGTIEELREAAKPGGELNGTAIFADKLEKQLQELKRATGKRADE